MIDLPKITLICASGIGYKTEGHIKAIQKSTEEINFGAVKYIQSAEIIDIDSWNKFIIYELDRYVDTEFCLLIHADGYVIRPDLWQDRWLNYDFIGAPFPLPTDSFSYRDIRGNIQRVGNSISLRSKRLIGLAPKLGLKWKPYHGFYNEDGFICVNNRHIYEDEGMRFAPFEEAVLFGKEHEIKENQGIDTFVFHEVNND